MPGQDLTGGPAGTTTLDSAITVSTNFATVGSTSVTVTLTLKQNSGASVASVSPSTLDVSGGTASCTGPTPASVSVPTGATGASVAWTCTLTESGEYVFSADAADATGDYAWPAASSASVLSASGGTNVVTWNLGSNTEGVPGETIDAGVPASIYGFRGANTTTFARFAIASGAWTARAAAPNAIAKGGALTSDGVNTLYGLRGNTTQSFYSYNATTDTWTTLANNTGVNVDEGGALVYLEVGGVKYVYALMGNGTGFRRYNATTPGAWTALAPTPNNVKKGGALTTDGTYIYALRGDKQKTFWRCNATTSGSAGSCDTSWSVLAPTLANMGWGASLTRIGNEHLCPARRRTKELLPLQHHGQHLDFAGQHHRQRWRRRRPDHGRHQHLCLPGQDHRLLAL